MSPAELRAALDAIGWSNRELASRVGFAEGTVRHWLTGRYPVPPDVAVWLAGLAEECGPLTARLRAIHEAAAAPPQ